MTGPPPRPRRPERRPLGHPGLVPERKRPRLDCRDVVARVTDYLEDALDREERDRIDQHLGACADCARVLDQWRVTIALVGRLGEEVVEDLGPVTRARLLAAFDERPPTP